jgi:hypothetical protein
MLSFYQMQQTMSNEISFLNSSIFDFSFFADERKRNIRFLMKFRNEKIYFTNS